jgi:2-polyprenyl-3-methyl-5-hydroxy-6-metoxy-1,4-benzoquinol methylase
MVSRYEVELAYRYILGREPESVAVVNDLAARYGSIVELRQGFIHSNEFQEQLASCRDILRPLLWPPSDIDVDVSPDHLTTMMHRVERTWERLGNNEPFWSVLTHDEFRATNVNKSKDAFYESGKIGVELFTAALGRAKIANLSAYPTCLEYGCGVGRLTVWLTQLFDKVIACDISEPHLNAAQTAIDQQHISNVDLIHTNSVDALSHLPEFDVFFSLIVLQHNPPPVATHILERILEKLNSGGLAYFQIPTYRLGYNFDADRYISSKEDSLEMEMHFVPQQALFALFQRRSCVVLEVREDDWTGNPQCVSNTFLLRKVSVE